MTQVGAFVPRSRVGGIITTVYEYAIRGFGSAPAATTLQEGIHR